jgi:hypothetical protein
MFSPIFGSHKIYVIHGYGSSKLMMCKIDKRLKKERFFSVNYGYRSVSKDLDTIGKELYVSIKKSRVDTISFVTHSMGALVVRSMLQYLVNDTSFPTIFRIVMIAPPNHGAEIADFYASKRILRKILGPNIEHMKTDSNSYANNLPVPDNSEIGIIIGKKRNKLGYGLFIKGDNDGLLTAERAKLNIAKDIIIVKGEHNFLTQNKFVRKLIVEFLQTGSFCQISSQLHPIFYQN